MFQVLSSLKNETAAILQELKELIWIDRATRFLSIDFTVYNANLNLFSIAKYVHLSCFCRVTCNQSAELKLSQKFSLTPLQSLAFLEINLMVDTIFNRVVQK